MLRSYSTCIAGELSPTPLKRLKPRADVHSPPSAPDLQSHLSPPGGPPLMELVLEAARLGAGYASGESMFASV